MEAIAKHEGPNREPRNFIANANQSTRPGDLSADLLEDDPKFLFASPDDARVPWDGIVSNDEVKGLGNADRGTDAQTGAVLGQIADRTIESAGVAADDVPAQQHSLAWNFAIVAHEAVTSDAAR
jgi:hypothetical protein